MTLTSIKIDSFRHLRNVEFNFGKIFTIIAGGNGTGKTSLLGMIGHIFKYGGVHLNLFNQRFETKYSNVFRFSPTHDRGKNYKYTLFFSDGGDREAQLREVSEGGRTRIDVGGRVRHGGKIHLPVVYLSLKRLVPLALEDEWKITLGAQSLTQELKQEYADLYNQIFSSTHLITPVHTQSLNKNTFSPTTANFDAHGISAGQDNIGHIILAILSFRNLKNTNQSYSGGLLLIDEIDATLYPAAQKNLMKVLLRLGRELDIQIIFTTHSSDILNFLSSRNGSPFKNSTNFVSLSNARGQVTAKQGFNELKELLADLNHEAMLTIRPKKINFYFEDNEAYLFYKSIVNDVDLDCDKQFKNLTLSCGTYKSLIDQGFEEFFRSVIVLDGDVSSTLPERIDNSVVLLPGIKRPENVIKDFLQSLPDDDEVWHNTNNYTKRVFNDSLLGVRDNREDMKKWFNSQLRFWGTEGDLVFDRWKHLNANEANSVVSRSLSVIRRIQENFHNLSIN